MLKTNYIIILTGRRQSVDVHFDHILSDQRRRVVTPRRVGPEPDRIGNRPWRHNRSVFLGRFVFAGTIAVGRRRTFRFYAFRRRRSRRNVVTITRNYVLFRIVLALVRLVFAPVQYDASVRVRVVFVAVVVVVQRPFLAQIQRFALFRHSCHH